MSQGVVWPREPQFREILQQHGRIDQAANDTLTKIAVEDARDCYKHVCVLLEKTIRRSNLGDRLYGVYLLANILRASRSHHKDKDKYARRLEDRMPKIFQALVEIPHEHQAKLMHIVTSWREEDIFPTSTLQVLEYILSQNKTSKGNTENVAKPSATTKPTQPQLPVPNSKNASASPAQPKKRKLSEEMEIHDHTQGPKGALGNTPLEPQKCDLEKCDQKKSDLEKCDQERCEGGNGVGGGGKSVSPSEKRVRICASGKFEVPKGMADCCRLPKNVELEPGRVPDVVTTTEGSESPEQFSEADIDLSIVPGLHWLEGGAYKPSVAPPQFSPVVSSEN